MSSILSKEDILNSQVRTKEEEAFGGTVLVRELPADLVQEWYSNGFINQGTGNVDVSKINYYRAAVEVLVDEDGERVFSQKERDVLKKKGYSDVVSVVMAAFDITDFGEEEDDEENPTGTTSD